jgi:predicted alpha/beta hydrolase family esterase
LLLVAPADPDRFGIDEQLPRHALGVPATLVASSNDPWLRLTSAGQLATRWRARFVAYAGAGHINAESGYGPWPEGLALLAQLERQLSDPPRERAAAS